MSEYALNGEKSVVTLASALNDLRLALEAVAARVRGLPPGPANPRTRSRAAEDAEDSAELDDGTRMDAAQLMQELATIVRDIAEAPSASQPKKRSSAKKKTAGGAPAEPERDPIIEQPQQQAEQQEAEQQEAEQQQQAEQPRIAPDYGYAGGAVMLGQPRIAPAGYTYGGYAGGDGGVLLGQPRIAPDGYTYGGGDSMDIPPDDPPTTKVITF